MTVHIALLRAVNVAGHGSVGMGVLRTFFEDLGFAGARTLLQSGNVVFQSGSPSDPAIERRLETEAEKRLGLHTTFFVRAAAEWEALIAGNPFPDQAAHDPSHLVAMCLKVAPKAAAVTALQAAIKGRELVRADGGRHVYITYPDGIGRSKLTAAVIEKALGSAGTARNWNTVLKLAALTEQPA